MKLYTWKDIERYFCLTQEKWRNVINSVEVYPTDIIFNIPENHQYLQNVNFQNFTISN